MKYKAGDVVLAEVAWPGPDYDLMIITGIASEHYYHVVIKPWGQGNWLQSMCNKMHIDRYARFTDADYYDEFVIESQKYKMQ